ncbi:MAG: pilus assembly PilX family protein [Nevskiales bacterium]
MVGMRSHQQGAILIVSLLFLLVLSIIGSASISTTTLQERMANNTREQNLALMAAEAALVDGENWLFSLKGAGKPPLPITSCSSNCGGVGIWAADTAQISNLTARSHSWWLTNGREHGADLTGTDSFDISSALHAQQPRYIVQRVNIATGIAGGSLGVGYGPHQEDIGPFLYRIVGYGVGRIEYEEGGELQHFDAVVESIYRISQF